MGDHIAIDLDDVVLDYTGGVAAAVEMEFGVKLSAEDFTAHVTRSARLFGPRGIGRASPASAIDARFKSPSWPKPNWWWITFGFASLALGPFVIAGGLNTFVPTPWAALPVGVLAGLECLAWMRSRSAFGSSPAPVW